MTRPTRAVLEALAEQPFEWRYGYDLSKATGLGSGTLYPLLMRIKERGWLESRWEPSPEPGRPARHMVRLTAEGRATAAALSPGAEPRLGYA